MTQKDRHKIFYNRYGYLKINNVLNQKDIKTVKKRLNKLAAIQKDGRGLSEPGNKKALIHSIHLDKTMIKTIETKPWFIKTSKKILNCDDIHVWNAKCNLKLRWHGSVEYYHQDYAYRSTFGFAPSNVVDCMIFVDDHSHYNGGLWLFPGSHKKSYKHIKFLNINSLQKYQISTKELDKLEKKCKPISIKARAGDCLFFHSKMVHGSAHNISNKNRSILLYSISTLRNFENLKGKKVKKIETFNRRDRIKFERTELKNRLKKIN